MLNEMITQRLQVASRTGSALKLRELCPQIPSIDSEMADCADGNPRAMLWLARALFRVHLQEPKPSDDITPESWEAVKKEWEVIKGTFSDKDDQNDFWISSDNTPYFRETKITVSPILSDLLRCLIKAKGAICTKESLILDAYQNNDPVYIKKTLNTFYEQMRNLRNELDKVAPGWLQTFRGQGYCLEKPKA